MKTARQIKHVGGLAYLYKLFGKFVHRDGMTDYVVLESKFVPGSGSETFVYPADEDGNKSAYGYSAGRVSHAAALKKMGFKALNCDNSYHTNSQS